MKRPHRKAHLVAWLVLAPLLLAALVWAVEQRPAPAVSDDLPGVEADEVFP